MKTSPRGILIVGGGPVGLATAALLAGGPAAGQLRIRVIDSGAEPHWHAARTDLRVYALSAATRAVLTDAGAWTGIAGKRISPYERMRIWEGQVFESAGQLSFDSADTGEPNLGAIVEDSLIRLALYEVLRSRGDVDFEFGRHVQSISSDDELIAVSLEGEPNARFGHLLIGADGANSQVRSAAQMQSVERDYGQHAIVAHVRSTKSHERTAWQRFLPGGPLALLPLADGRSSVVWSLPKSQAQHWLAADADAFERRLGFSSGGVLGELSLDSERAALPLIARHAPQYCQARIALVGDAAHSVHPLAGQGVNLGLADACELAAQISAAVLAGQDPGDLRVLRRYQRARQAANLFMLGALDGLDRIFRAPQILAPLRTTGLRLVNRLPLLKKQLIRHASGSAS